MNLEIWARPGQQSKTWSLHSSSENKVNAPWLTFLISLKDIPHKVGKQRCALLIKPQLSMHWPGFNLTPYPAYKNKTLTKLVVRVNENRYGQRSWLRVPHSQLALGKFQFGAHPQAQREEFSPFLPHIHLPVLHANVWLEGEVGPRCGYLRNQLEAPLLQGLTTKD